MTPPSHLADLAQEILDLELETFEIRDYSDSEGGLMLAATSTTSCSTTSSSTSCTSSCG
ncbi:thiazolylpeptide-type bacteriocin [Streptacidiphilus sp. 4-A2]|nr:thiazolylpeptide-type bacteriocin [Streptacidiphilus sp. 4-A2]